MSHYDTPTTEENIDRRVGEWHELCQDNNCKIYEWLGLTQGQYFFWVETEKLPTIQILNVDRDQINKIARILAYEYALGYIDSKTLSGLEPEPSLQNAKKWADDNWETFVQKAELSLGMREPFFIDHGKKAKDTIVVYTESPTKK